MRAARLGQAMESGAKGARIYPRYPRYPQAESAFIALRFMTASGGGRDDLPATEESLPSHSPSRTAFRLTTGSGEAKGRAADEAAARRKLRACPLADAKAACFVKRPSVSRRPSGTWETVRRDTGPSGSGPARRKAGLRSTRRTGGTGGFGPWIFRAGPGFGPGAAKPADPGFRSMDARRNRGFGRGSRRTRLPRLRPSGHRQGGKRDASSKSAERRTVRASALSGSPRGNRNGLRPGMDPGGSGASSPRFERRRLETAQRGTPRLPG